MVDIGRSIYSSVPPVFPSSARPLTAQDLGALSPNYSAEFRTIEEEAEESLRMALGRGYEEDPFILPLAKLPRDVRDEYIARIDRLTGLSNLLQQGIGPTMFRDYTRSTPLGEQVERSPAGRFIFENAALSDPRVLRLSQQTIRFDHARSILTAEQYYSAGTFYRTRMMNYLQRQIDNQLSTDVVTHHRVRPSSAVMQAQTRPGRVLTFDVETSGLAPGSDVWQLSARMTQDGRTIGDRTFAFNAPRMRWGGEIGPNRTNLQDFLNSGGVDDYAEGMKEFFRMAGQSDYLAGHNVLFDYRMLRHGIVKHRAYSRDPEFKRLADQFLNRFYNQDTGEIGNIIDTNMLARTYLHHIPLAKELAGGPTPYQFSLQNILLQTNLLERVKAAEGPEQVAAWMSKGFHFADVDVPFEAHLITALQEMAQGTGPGLRVYETGTHGLTETERQAILQSRPIGPNINFTAEEQLHPDVLARAKRAGLIEYGPDGELRNIRVTPMENMIMASRSLTDRTTGPGIGGAVRGFWQRLGAIISPSTMELANQAGTWDRIARVVQDKQNKVISGFVGKEGTIVREGITPTPQSWAVTQEELRNANVPLPGLSWIERHLTATLGTTRAEGAEGTIRSVFGQDVAPLGRFVASQEVGVLSNSLITRLPISILEQWEQGRLDAGEEVSTGFTRPGERLQMLTGSFFEPNIKGKPQTEMGLMVHLSEDERTSLLGFLKQHPSVVGNEELQAMLERSLTSNTAKYGIQIGTLTGLKGGAEAKRVRDVFEQIMGPGADRSDQTPTVWLPYAGRDLLTGSDTPESIYTMGAIVKSEALDDEERAALADATRVGAERYRQLSELTDTPMMKILLNAQDSRHLYDDEALARRVISGYSKVRQASPFIGGVAALAGYSYYRRRKHQRQARINQVMAAQPLEPQQQYTSSDRRYSSNYNNNMGLVNQLDANKINHTQMGPSKYNYLFGATGYNT